MASSDGNRANSQEQARCSAQWVHESTLKARHVTSSPVFVAMVALSLVLLGVVLGAAGALLVSGDHHLNVSRRPPLTVPIADSAAPMAHHRRFLSERRPNAESLESIMYHYRSDKSKDNKKYSDLYAMLFDAIRMTVRNVTEVGMGDGGSMMTWHDYFRKANIYGIDRSLSRVKTYLGGLSRLRLLKADPLEARVATLGLKPGSMDVVFESAGRGLKGQEKILPRMWPLVREGGYYVIEDVSFDRNADGFHGRPYPFLHNPQDLPEEVRRILSENDAFFADTTLGHRAFEEFIREQPGDLDRFSHSAHVIVIRKRTEALRAVAVNARSSLPLPPGPGLPLSSYVRRQMKSLGL